MCTVTGPDEHVLHAVPPELDPRVLGRRERRADVDELLAHAHPVGCPTLSKSDSARLQ
jgi:hypothetical protein